MKSRHLGNGEAALRVWEQEGGRGPAPSDIKTGSRIAENKTIMAAQHGAAAANPPAVTEAPKVPALYDYGEDAGAGFEGTTKDDFLIPMLDILQSKSPEVEKETIPGAKAGMFIIRALGLVFDGKDIGLGFVPAISEHKFIRWAPREKGNGIVAQFSPDDDFVKQAKAGKPFGKILLGTDPKVDDTLVETFYLYGTLILPGGTDVIRAVASFASTKISAYKGLMTKAQGVMVDIPPGPDGKPRRVNPPLWAHRYRLKTFFKEKGGNTWWNYTGISFDADVAQNARLDPRSDLYRESKDFHEQIRAGKITVDTRGAENGEPDEGGHTRVNPEDMTDESVPF